MHARIYIPPRRGGYNIPYGKTLKQLRKFRRASIPIFRRAAFADRRDDGKISFGNWFSFGEHFYLFDNSVAKMDLKDKIRSHKHMRTISKTETHYLFMTKYFATDLEAAKIAVESLWLLEFGDTFER